MPLQNECVLQQKYSGIQKEPEIKQPQQNETENKMENNCDKSKIPLKTSGKESINDSSKIPSISNSETFMKEETEKNNPAKNKKTGEQGIESSHEKEKTTSPKEESTQDTAKLAKNRSNDQQRLRKSVVVLVGSMTKQLNGWEMSKRIKTNRKIHVKTFAGATTTCVEDYTKPPLRMFPDHFILHIGTGDLTSSKSSQEIANSIINLACQLKTKLHDVSLSSIILRADDTKLNQKRCEVSSHLKQMF